MSIAVALLSVVNTFQRLLNRLYVPASHPCLASVPKKNTDGSCVAEIKAGNLPQIHDFKAADADKMLRIQSFLQFLQRLARFISAVIRAKDQFPVFRIDPDNVILSDIKQSIPLICRDRRILISQAALHGADDSVRQVRLPACPDNDFRFLTGRINFQTDSGLSAQFPSLRLLSMILPYYMRFPAEGKQRTGRQQ